MRAAVLCEAVQRDGFCLLPAVWDAATGAQVAADLEGLPGQHRRDGQVYASRRLLDDPLIAALAQQLAIRLHNAGLFAARPHAIRGQLLDKTPQANWQVDWRQDLVIALAQQIPTPGFSAWSNKDGVPHAQPPRAILENILAVRIHLDDCGPDNGPLHVLPGTHQQGVLSDDAITQATRTHMPVAPTAQTGDALLLRPLLLHASYPARSGQHRRVIHIDFTDAVLPNSLTWRWPA